MKTILMLTLLMWQSWTLSAKPESGAQIAAQVGLPGIEASLQVAGPFVGQQGTIYYLGDSGLITYFHPNDYVAYFGQINQGAMKYHYMLSPQGQYVVNEHNQAVAVAVLPDDVYRWPHANAVAGVLIQYLMAVQQGLANPPTPSNHWSSLSTLNADMHQTTLSILNNMGSQGCTEYYDDVYYLGCW